MKKILCPTDFSETAENAVVYAAQLAKELNASLTLLNIQPAIESNLDHHGRGTALLVESAKDLLKMRALDISSQYQIVCDADVETALHSFTQTLGDLSEKFDLIVMGSNGADDLVKFFNGSNTYHAIRESHIPLLMVPQNYHYQQIKTIVYAYDYFRERILPLNQLIPLVRILRCQLNVLQVMEESYSKEAEEYLKELQITIRNFYADDTSILFATLHEANIAKTIHDYVLNQKPDILALCTVNRNFMENLFHSSVIKYITRVSGYPVFIFHN